MIVNTSLTVPSNILTFWKVYWEVKTMKQLFYDENELEKVDVDQPKMQ